LNTKLGLLGSITHDVITYESGPTFKEIGGVLYQAAVLCGLGKDVFLYTNLGKEQVSDVKKIIEPWLNLNRKGIKHVPWSGNQVHLHYPKKGERVEILKSVVPPLNPDPVIEDLSELEMIVLVINSGYDIELKDWQKVVRSATCPIWLDIHSLALARSLGVPRQYISLIEWKKWAEGVDYLQANRQEVASLLGFPDRLPNEAEIICFGRIAFYLGVKVVFITLGKEGGLVMTQKSLKKIASPQAKSFVDTTGCGDVFCGATVTKLMDGFGPFEAASFGFHMASKAVYLKGIEETYSLALRYSCNK